MTRPGQPIKFNESHRHSSFSFPSTPRPSICVSFVPNEGIKEENLQEEQDNKKSAKSPSQLRKSIRESERSVSLLIERARRRLLFIYV